MNRKEFIETSRNQLARDIIEKFPNTPKLGLAKILFKLHPMRFKDVEDARGVVRTVTGTHGKAKNAILTTAYKGLPKGIKNDYTPYILASGKYGVMSDIHIPYHDERAVDLALNYFRKHGVKNLLLNGDIIDCYQQSDFQKDPTMPSIREEFQMLREWLTWISKDFRIVLKLGNHCERWERYLMTKAPAIFDLEILSWDFMVHEWWKLPQIPIVADKRLLYAGKLSIVHGNEFGRSIFTPVNPARGLWNRGKANILCGHYHQVSEHTTTDIRGKIYGTWSTGCLCDLHPKYRPLNEWQNGFATVEHETNGDFEVHNFRIIDGKIR